MPEGGLPETGWGHSRHALENEPKSPRFGEATCPGDIGQAAMLRFGEKSPGQIDALFVDEDIRRPPQCFSKAVLEPAAREVALVQQPFDAKRFTEVLTDEADRGEDVRILDRKSRGGPPFDDSIRGHQQGVLRGRGTPNQTVQQRGSLVTHPNVVA